MILKGYEWNWLIYEKGNYDNCFNKWYFYINFRFWLFYVCFEKWGYMVNNERYICKMDNYENNYRWIYVFVRYFKCYSMNMLMFFLCK